MKTYKEIITDLFLNKKIKVITDYPTNPRESNKEYIGTVTEVLYFSDDYEGDTLDIVLKKSKNSKKLIQITENTKIEFL